jgi:hypothetical protein
VKPVLPLNVIVKTAADSGLQLEALTEEQFFSIGQQFHEALEKDRKAAYERAELLRAAAREDYNNRLLGRAGAQHRKEVEIARQLGHDGLFKPGVYVVLASVKKGVWEGPFRVLEEVSQYVYKVENLVTRDVTEAHATRLRYYADDRLNVSTQLLQQIKCDQNKWVIEKLGRLKKFMGTIDEWKVEVFWRGFEPEDSTWEPVRIIAEDVVIMFKKHLEAYPERDVVATVQAYLQGARRQRGKRAVGSPAEGTHPTPAEKSVVGQGGRGEARVGRGRGHVKNGRSRGGR